MAFLENGAKEISVVNSIRRRAEKYNAAMENAPPKLLDIYLNLYTKGYTQEATAAILGYSPQYINLLNNNLLMLKFLLFLITDLSVRKRKMRFPLLTEKKFIFPARKKNCPTS